jgi:hypothetical protein
MVVLLLLIGFFSCRVTKHFDEKKKALEELF